MPESISTAAVIVAFLLSLFNLWDKIDSRIKAAKAPTKLLSDRLDTLENRVNVELNARFNEYDSHFEKDLSRIESIEEGNKVTQKAILALLAHARDGNNTDQLVRAENELTQYLIDK